VVEFHESYRVTGLEVKSEVNVNPKRLEESFKKLRFNTIS
jgi:hypothetical protein